MTLFAFGTWFQESWLKSWFQGRNPLFTFLFSPESIVVKIYVLMIQLFKFVE